MPSTRQRSTRNRLMLVATVAGGGFLALGACGSPSNPDNVGTTNGGDDVTVGGGCGVPAKGCPCAPDGLTQSCEEVIHNGNYTTCAQGKLTCTGGTWSACVTSHAMFKSLGPVGSPMPAQPQVLSDAAVPDAGSCSACDPTCNTFIDTSTGVDGGSGLTSTDGGWTLPLGMGDGGTCVGLQCSVPNCSGGQTTTITGTVYDPAGLNPVYNAVVAIPNAAVAAIPAGVSSDPCGGAPLPAAVSFAYSGTDGTFTLTGVPVGASIPLVIQIGRWRRMTTINTSALTCGHSQNISSACPTGGAYSYAAAASCPTRLPRRQGDLDLSGTADGSNIPHIAIGTGGLDAIECMLYRMGVSSAEYTDENGTGRVHMFDNGGADLPNPAASHDISYLMGFTCPTGQCPSNSSSTAGITNPGFDTGSIAGWTVVNGSNETIFQNSVWNTTAPDSVLLGQYACGAYTNLDTIQQSGMVAPAGAIDFAVDYRAICNGAGSYAKVSLTDNTAGGTQSCSPGCPNGTQTCTLAVTPGDSYTVQLINNDQAGSGWCGGTFFDSARWIVSLTPANLLPNYDLVMLPCDGGGEYNSANWNFSYDDPGRLNLVNYANIGGRVFTSHWGREWIERPFNGQAVGPFQGSTAATQVANWIGDQALGDSVCVINSATAWGTPFDAWMKAVGATAGNNITINPDREDTKSVTANSQMFVSYQATTWPADFTFNTPVGSATPAGRVMYTDMHLANGTPSGTFPGNCPPQGGALSQQEDAAEYLLFDLGACVNGLPPPVTQQYNPATFTRDYDATNACPSGYRPVWHLFQYEDTTPSDSNITFTAYTADSQAQLGTQYMVAPLITASGGDVCPPTPWPPYPGPSCSSEFVSVDVDTQLKAAGVPTTGQPPYSSHPWLRVNMTLNPSSDKMSAPTLIAWNQALDCVSSE